MSQSEFLITGATGQQGGSVVDALLKKGVAVDGMTRRADSGGAKALKDRGVGIVTANMDDPVALAKAFQGYTKIFLMGSPFEGGVEEEIRQGKNAVGAAKQAGVSYIVYSSVSDADKKTGIPHFDSKYEVEQELRHSGIAWAIQAPVYFYDNMAAPFVLPGLKNGAFAQPLPADRSLQSISVKNLGEFAALMLTQQEKFQGKRYNIAGDDLTGEEYARILGRASGRQIGYTEVPLEAVRENSEDMAQMYGWFNAVGYSVDIPGLKASFPEVSWESFEQWAMRQDWSTLLS